MSLEVHHDLLLVCFPQGADGELAFSTEETPVEADNATDILNSGQ